MRIIDGDALLQMFPRGGQFGGPEQLTAHLEMGVGTEFRVLHALGEFDQLSGQRSSRAQIARQQISVSQPIERPEMRGRVCSAPPTQVDRASRSPLGFRGTKSATGPEGWHQSHLEHKLLLVALRTLRKAVEHFDATGQVGNGFHVRGTLDRALARAPPVGDGLLCKPCLGEMLGHEFGLPLDDVGKVAFKRRGDPRM